MTATGTELSMLLHVDALFLSCCDSPIEAIRRFAHGPVLATMEHEVT